MARTSLFPPHLLHCAHSSTRELSHASFFMARRIRQGEFQPKASPQCPVHSGGCAGTAEGDLEGYKALRLETLIF